MTLTTAEQALLKGCTCIDTVVHMQCHASDGAWAHWQSDFLQSIVGNGLTTTSVSPAAGMLTHSCFLREHFLGTVLACEYVCLVGLQASHKPNTTKLAYLSFSESALDRQTSCKLDLAGSVVLRLIPAQVSATVPALQVYIRRR